MKQFATVFSFLFLLLIPNALLEQPAASASPLEEAKALVNSMYVGEMTDEMQNAQTLDELMSYLDVHSEAYTREEYESLLQSIDQQTVGIGVVIEKHEYGVLISRVIKGGSAEAAGIVAGDIILEVDGVDVSNATISDASSKITGPPNTKVQLKILKANGEVVQLTINRTLFTSENVTSSILYGNIGYIAFESFSSTVDREITREYNRLKNLGATSFIVDVRNNGGGYVDTAEKVIGMFPRARLAYTLIDSNGKQIILSNTNSRNRAIFPANTRVLLNGFSASASEMLAGALKDQRAAYIYGTTSYGKGTMQAFFELTGGEYYIKLTIAEFQSPFGKKIDQVGIQPDVNSNTPLQQAHFEALTEKYAEYKELPKMNNVKPTKTFKINFNKNVTTDIQYDAIELVELGGDKVDVQFIRNGSTVEVKPIYPLKADAQYALFIHPTLQSKHNKSLKSGAYMHITVGE